MRNRLGQADMSIDWSVALLFIILCAALLAVIVATFHKVDVDTTHISPDVYVAKIYFSPEILTYVEDDVIRFGTIDVDKFTQAHFDRSNQYIEEFAFLGANLTVVDSTGTVLLDPIYNNKDLYETYHPFGAANENKGVGGRGGATINKQILPVQLSDGREGFLEIELVVPND